MNSVRTWINSGSPWVWLNAGAVSVALVMVISLLLLIAARGLGQFWPGTIAAFEYREGKDTPPVPLWGEVIEAERITASRLREMGFELPAERKYGNRYLIKTGNRDVLGNDFRWVVEAGMSDRSYPADIAMIEREEWGNFYGQLLSMKESGASISSSHVLDELQQRLKRKDALRSDIRHIEKSSIGAVNYDLEQLRLKQRQLQLKNIQDPAASKALEQRRAELQQRYEGLSSELGKLYQDIKRDSLVVKTAEGKEVEIPLEKIVRVSMPNQMSVLDKSAYYLAKLWEFVSAEPREANTEGGIFPAIFGTVLMVLIMTLFVTPFGVLAAVYLKEYAKQGPLTRIVRIAVNNLAGVPSVVYGVFGLGFFVYFVGSNIDRLFFPEALPAPTFGTPGMLWSAITLALLTVPVVIVATEEGLARVPRAIREGSLALGATKAETLWRTVLPMATPALMTGLILAIARAAGEVAPLMMVGVVKLAPALALDGNFPFLHMDRKFMHLGFHIYDVGFQSPNVEAARPLVYATTLLLVVIIIGLNLAAIRIRNRLREKYNASDN